MQRRWLEMILSLSEDVKAQSETVSAGLGTHRSSVLEAALRNIVGWQQRGCLEVRPGIGQLLWGTSTSGRGVGCKVDSAARCAVSVGKV